MTTLSSIMYMMMALVALVALGVFVLAADSLADFIGRRMDRRRAEAAFLATFGSAPPVKKDIPFYQKAADEAMTDLASRFSAACQQEQLLLVCQPAGSFEAADQHVVAIKAAAQAVAEAKSAFWVAHDAAEDAGFAVRDSFQDYLRK